MKVIFQGARWKEGKKPTLVMAFERIARKLTRSAHWCWNLREWKGSSLSALIGNGIEENEKWQGFWRGSGSKQNNSKTWEPPALYGY